MAKEVTIGIGMYVWNGEKTISKTLHSIIKQTYKNFIIYILDNQSTDRTAQIVRRFQKKDKRIKLIIDKKKRDQGSAPKFLLNQFLKKFKYCLIIGDDDIYEKKFIEIIFNKLTSEKLNMVYSSLNLIDLNEKKYKIKNFPTYCENSSIFFNLIKFIIYRNCANLFCAGIYQTKSLIRSYKYMKIYDSSLANYENLMLIDFLANNKVGYVNNKLFNYRVKDRIEAAKNRNQKGLLNLQKNSISKLAIFIYQFNFAIRVIKIVNKSHNLNIIEKNILLLLVFLLYFQKCTSYIIKSFLKVEDIYKNRTV
jgi:glycosyltransferase involved in cell wall biosynthesis